MLNCFCTGNIRHINKIHWTIDIDIDIGSGIGNIGASSGILIKDFIGQSVS